jgi:zinc protease
MPRALSSLSLLALCAACSSPPAANPPPAPPQQPLSVATPSPEDFRNTRPPSGAEVPHEYPAIETARLDNGLSLYVVHQAAGVVSLSVVAKGGGAKVGPGQSGLAALTVRMMTEGTRQRGALALAESVEALGTTLEEEAGRDSVRLGMTALRDDLRPSLALLSEVVREPTFAPAELERVRKEWLDSIEAERQSPARLSAVVGLRLLLGTTAGAPVNGSRHDVAALKRADLVRFYQENFVPGNLALVVVGDVTLTDVTPLAKEFFGKLGGAAPAARPATPSAVPSQTAPQAPAGKVFVVDRPGAVQSALFVAQRFPTRAEPGFEARELLNNLLGGLFTSRLNMNLREEHAFTYGARSLDMATRYFGAFAVMTSVRTDVTGAALAEALAEVKKAKDPALGRPIADAEVKVARSDLKQQLGVTLSDTEEIAGRVEDLFVHDLPVDYLRKYPALLDAASHASVAQEGQRLDPDHAVIVVVGDKKAIAGQLAGLALPVVDASDLLAD